MLCNDYFRKPGQRFECFWSFRKGVVNSSSIGKCSQLGKHSFGFFTQPYLSMLSNEGLLLQHWLRFKNTLDYNSLNPYCAMCNYSAFTVLVHECCCFFKLPVHLCGTFLGHRNCWQAPCLHVILIRKIPTVQHKLYVNREPEFYPTFWCQI